MAENQAALTSMFFSDPKGTDYSLLSRRGWKCSADPVRNSEECPHDEKTIAPSLAPIFSGS
ncbi:MAG: hypothetical protein QM636_22670, partial [Rhizobium sp.]